MTESKKAMDKRIHFIGRALTTGLTRDAEHANTWYLANRARDMLNVEALRLFAEEMRPALEKANEQTAGEAYRSKVTLLEAKATLLAHLVDELKTKPETSTDWADVGDVARAEMLLGQALAVFYSKAGGKQKG